MRAVSALCLDLKTRELAANPGVTSIPSGFPVDRYLVFRRNVDALTPAFDRRVAAVPVPAGASAVATDFRAYQREEDGLRAKAAAAARRSQAAYNAEYAREMTLFVTDPVLVALDSDGFSGACHYR